MAIIERNSSLDAGYVSGDLSLFPLARDDKEQLYQVENNAKTILKQSLSYNGKYIVVDDNSGFPPQGLIRIGPAPGESGSAELIYYDKKVTGIFRDLIRGFAGSRQNRWSAGKYVTNAVMAEHHNAVKDAVLQIERDLGTEDFPAEETLNFILKEQERRFLAPKALFRAWPNKGPASLMVRFQNFTTGDPVRFLWDFGDGTTSVERSPIHTYTQDGIYSVRLNVITSLGAQGIASKSNYITVSDEEKQPFFYVSPLEGYSVETAAEKTADGNPTDPTVFTFVDQTDGDITQRYWILDGDVKTEDALTIPGQSLAVLDPNVHTSTAMYDVKGSYEPSLLVLFANQRLKRAFLKNEITVF
jgi:PKD repeat protein